MSRDKRVWDADVPDWWELKGDVGLPSDEELPLDEELQLDEELPFELCSWRTEKTDIMRKKILVHKLRKRGSGSSIGHSETRSDPKPIRTKHKRKKGEPHKCVRKKFSFPPPVPPSDLQDKYKEDGNLVWISDDSGLDSDCDGNCEDLVVLMPEINYLNRLAEKQEIKNLHGTRSAERKIKLKRGHWVCIDTKPCTAWYCEICNKDCDHVARTCPNNKDRTGTSASNWLCKICMKVGHGHAQCPYLDFVPRGAKLGPGGVLVCKCCGGRGGHPEHTKWIGYAVFERCLNCGAVCDHSTEDCKKPKREKGILWMW